ncbi:MAG TPA: plasmid stabilization protein [Candidatus Marinimicrobia bacterium]|nr:plasmid stabilization protein [Candidatus Neomarinimicrobiota bacterium]
MKLVWTPTALQQLSEIEQFIAQDNPLAALEFVTYLIDRAETIRENPKMGRIVPELGEMDIREIIAKNYRIVYRLKGPEIQILTVFEGHHLLPDKL